MINSEKDFGFSFDSFDGERSKFFNIDGSDTEHVTIWIESYDDRRFWMSYIKSNSKYKFTLKTPDQSQSSDGKTATGCERLFSLERSGDIVLGKHNIYCLDSDDSFIKCQIKGYKSKKAPRDFIYYTNVYSIESAMLDLDHLDDTFVCVTGQGLESIATPPSKLLIKISEVVYEEFITACFFEAITQDDERSTYLRKNLVSEVKLLSDLLLNENIDECKALEVLSTNIKKIHEDIVAELDKLSKNDELSNFKKGVSQLGIHSKNIFLFLNGHFLFDLIMCIYQKFSDSLKVAEANRLKSSSPNSVQAIKSLKNGWPKFSDSLKFGFFAKKPEVEFLCETFERFEKDYA